MEQKDFLKLIPEQNTGKEIETIVFVELEDINEAMAFYNIAKERLLNVNKWHSVAGLISARFQAIDKNGNVADREVQKGDYLKIDIPGPGSNAGEGYDWVIVEELKEMADEEVQSIGFRVRPASNPISENKDIAHFYDAAATSNFIITREGKKVTAFISDRNLKPNNETESITDKIRDTAVGMSAITVFSKIQWQNLTNGLVQIDK